MCKLTTGFWVLLLLAWSSAGVAAGPEAGSNASVSPEWDAAALESALTFAGNQRSSALVIAQERRVIAERYWSPKPAPGSPYGVFWAIDSQQMPGPGVAD